MTPRPVGEVVSGPVQQVTDRATSARRFPASPHTVIPISESHLRPYGFPPASVTKNKRLSETHGRERAGKLWVEALSQRLCMRTPRPSSPSAMPAVAGIQASASRMAQHMERPARVVNRLE